MVGTQNATLGVTFFNALVSSSSNRAVTGTAVTPGDILIGDGPAYDYQSIATGASVDHTFTLTNQGNYVASAMDGAGLVAPFSFKGGTFPGAGGTCATSLNPAATCTVVVTFAPTATGAQSGTFNITYNDGALVRISSRNVTGTGAIPASLAISDVEPYDYGVVAVGATTSHSFVISNSGGVPATAMSGAGLSAPFTFKGGTYPGTGGTCTSALASAATCTVVVNFAPSTPGVANANLNISYNTGVTGATVTRGVQGTGAPPASLSISNGPTYSYGTVAVNSSNDRTFTVTNSGAITAANVNGSGLSAPYAFKGGSFPGTGGTCATTLGPGSTCTLVLTFAPTTTGTFTGTATVGYDDGVGTVATTRALTGVGAPPATMTISDGTTYDYGTKGTGSSTDKTFTVTNSGGVNATAVVPAALAAPFLFKGGSYPGTGGTCTTTLNASQTCTVVVSFAPVATGAQTATISFTFDDGANPLQISNRALTGTGAAPATLTISESTPYDFGSVATGGKIDHAFTIENTGGVPATAIAITGLSAPFTFKGGTFPGTGGTCTTAVNPAANCTVMVTFAPTVPGVQNTTMSVGYNDGITTQSTPRGLTGTGVPPSTLTFSDGPLYDYGPVVATAFKDYTFTITNAGSIGASAMTGVSLSAPYSFKGGAYPGTGGTCGTTLSPAATCTLVVTFRPTSTGSFSANVSINYFDGAANQTGTRAVQGAGATAALLTLSDGPTYNYGTVANGATINKTLIITNGGGVSATALAGQALAPPYSFLNGSYPGTGGTCGGTLAVAGTCTMIVNFNPTALGATNATVAVSYFDGLNNQSSSRPVTGTAVAPATISVTDVTTSDYGTIAVGASVDRTFQLSNSGAFAASTVSGGGLAAPFAFKGGSFPGAGGTCTATLNASASCTVVATFAPTATGAQSDSFDITYFDGAFPQTVAHGVSGTGATPATLAISDLEPYDFGTIANGATLDHTFTIANSGGVPATAVSGSGLSAPFTFKGGGYPGTGGSCGAVVAAAGNCTVVVTFAPTTAGLATATLNLAYNTGAAPAAVARSVRGTGALPATISISDGSTYNFGTVAINSSTDKTFTLTNGGNFVATAINGSGLSGAYAFKGGSYPGTGGTCATTLAASTTCTIVATFAPTALGTFTATTTIGYFDGALTRSSTRPLTGLSAPAATMTISDGVTYDFGTQATGSSTDKTFTVTNSGGVDATAVVPGTLSAPFTFKGGAYPGNGGTCGATLSASQSCSVVVSFQPTATGLQTGTIAFGFNDGATATQTSTRPMRGTGAAPATLTISETSPYDFGSVATGGFTDKTFTIANTGGVPAATIAITGLSAPFTFKGGTFPGTGGTCTATLAPAANCTVNVTFAPTVTGLQTTTMAAAYYDGAGNQSTPRDLKGTGVAPALLTLSDGPTFDYGPVVATGSLDRTFVVTNGGSLAASSIAGVTLPAPFAFKGGTFPGTGGTCGASLAAAATCTTVVTFNPTATGSFTATISINYFNGAVSQVGQRAIQGTGATAASLTISDGPTYNFGTVANGASVDKLLTITNGGGVTGTALAGAGLSAPYTFKGGSFPGTGGTCAATLAAAGTCTVVVNYNPTAVATTSQTLQINYFDGLTARTSTRPVTGTAVTPANITVGDVTSSDFGTIAVGASSDRTFNLTNVGAFTASSLSGNGLTAPFSFKGGAFPGVGGTCTTTLNASASCTVVGSFTPTATGAQSGSFNVTYFDGAFAQTVPHGITGTGATPATLAISDNDPYDFGTLANGASADRYFTISNSGGVPATGLSGSGLGAPFTFKGGSYPGSGGTCGSSVAAAGTCTVVVTFAPTVAGVQNSSFTIAYNTGAAPASVARSVRGTGALPAMLSLTDGPTYNFGTVAINSTNDKTLTLTNAGSFPATSLSGTGLSAPYTYKGGSYPGTGGNCATTLGAGMNCTIVVNFSPVALGTFNATASLGYYDGANNQTATRNFTGLSAPAATMTISDAITYDFGTKATGSATDKAFTVTNSGGVNATGVVPGVLPAPYAFKDGTYPGTGGTCGTTLNASQSCSIVVTFAPTATGLQTATIGFTFNDGATATQTSSRPLKGTGAAPATLTISENSPYDYGSVATGGFTDKAFTLANTGGVPATTIAITGLTAPFTFKGGTFPGSGGTCTATLAAAANCTVVVTFAPTVVGTQYTTMAAAYFDGAANQSSPRDLKGTGVAPALLTLTDGPTFDYGPVVATGSLDHTFTVNNSGSLTASGISGVSLSTPFAFKGGTFPGTGGTCGASLNAAATCTVTVTFNPTVTGSFTATVGINYFDGANPQVGQRAVQGTGATAASITISDGATFNFGTVANGASVDKTLTLTNGGGVIAKTLAGAGLSAPYGFKGGSFPGTGGTCAVNLAASQTCTVVVNYNPTAIATTNQTLQVSYFDGLTSQTATRPVTGTAVAPANITIGDVTSSDFGTIAVGATADRTFSLNNTGAVTASSLGGNGLIAPFSFKGGAFPGAGGTCTNTLNASASCTVVGTFAPTATGAQSGSFNVTYFDGAFGQSVAHGITGTGATPATLSISDTEPYDYGTFANGATSDHYFTISNSGGVPATALSGSGLGAPFTFKGGTYPGSGGTCGSSVAAAGNCTVVVSFAPTVAGTQNSTFTIAYSTGAMPASVTRGVRGTGALPASLTISNGPTFNFGTVAINSTNDQILTITNGGSFSATAMVGQSPAAPYTFKGGSYPGTGGNCATTLGAGLNCTIVVNFLPTALGTFNATAGLSYFDGAATQSATRNLTGQSAPAATMTISDAITYDYGTKATGSSTDKTFTVTNSGGVNATSAVPATLPAPFTYKDGTYPGTGGTCATTLNASQSCTVVVTFAPTATGLQTASLGFTFNDGATASQTSTRPIRGTGAAPATLTISESSPYDYGSVATGGFTDKAFTLANTGGVPAASIAITGLSAPFTFKGGTFRARAERARPR